MADQTIDILIVGGGLAGASLMLALSNLGYKTLLVEAKPYTDRVKENFDARTLALAPASVNILKNLHVWSELEALAVPIKTIHVSEQRRFGLTVLEAEKNEPLGYVVEMQHINRALHQLLPEQQVLAPAQLIGLNFDKNEARIKSGTNEFTVAARLIVAADGADSSVRQLCGIKPDITSYRQVAIVANIGLARDHQHGAYERFTPSGPLALLPMSNKRSSLIWSVSPDKAAELMALTEHNFLNRLQREFGYRLGRFEKVGQRIIYPLRQVIMNDQVHGMVVFVGNAAHTLHPVAGQGFNLGLRDVAMLAQCVVNHGLNNAMLDKYRRARHDDQQTTIRFTNGLISLFLSQLPGVGVARSTGMMAMNNAPMIKNLLARYAKGYAGVIPDLVCNIPLQQKDHL